MDDLQQDNQNNKKTFLSSLMVKIILVMIIFAGSAIIIISGTKFIVEYYKMSSNNKIVKQVKQTEQEKNQTDTSDLSSKVLATDDWQTYQNEEFGFELRYPKDWTVNNNDNYISFNIKENNNESQDSRFNKGYWLNVKIYQNLEKSSLEQYIAELIKDNEKLQKEKDGPMFEYDEVKKVKIADNISAYKFYNVYGGVITSYEYIYLLNEKYIYEFMIPSAKKNTALLNPIINNKIANQILSTFKFIDKDETADWQTYQNTEFGFEVKYPKDWKAIRDGDENVLFFDNSFYANEYKLSEGPEFEDKYRDYAFISISRYPEGTRTAAGTITKDTEIKDFVYKLYSKDYFVSEETIIGGQKAYMFGCTAYLKQDNDIVVISISSGPEYTNYKKLTATFHQILSTFKFIDKDETEVDHPECSAENPPKVYSGKTGEMLNLCGKKTDYLAYGIKEENIILFQTKRWDNQKEKHHYSIKTITTVYPYKEKILVDGLGDFSWLYFISPYFYQKNSLYFWDVSEGGPGYYHNLFIFSPSTEEFLISNDGLWNGTYSVNFISSNLKQKFWATKKYREWERREIHILRDDEIEIVVNGKSFTKKEVDEGKANLEKSIFDCHILPFLTPISKFGDNNDEIAAKYANYFPTKIPCFKDSVPNIDTKNQLVGYFDIETGKIIFLEDEN